MSARPIDFGAPSKAPRRIGKYVVSHVLGEGAMGIVYKGIDPHIDRPVAIKTVRRQLLAPGAQDLSAALRFQREAKAAGRLSHPNIVPVYEYGEDGADLYIAMEYIEGCSLLNLTSHGTRVSVEDALSVMRQLLDALDCAHAQQIWHRDIKPGNLLITADGRLKVTDFGIARIDSAHLTQLNTVMGSPGYMAPERYTGEAPDQRVDLFSCGVVLYELLTGAAPFKGTVSSVMYQVLNQDPPPPSTLDIPNPPPAGLDAVVARAMARRADDRFGSAKEMRDALIAASAQPIRMLLSGQALARLRPPLTDVATQWLPRQARPDDGLHGVADGAPNGQPNRASNEHAPTAWLDRRVPDRRAPVPTSDQSTLPGATATPPPLSPAGANLGSTPNSIPESGPVPAAASASASDATQMLPIAASPGASAVPTAPATATVVTATASAMASATASATASAATSPAAANAEALTRIDRLLRPHLGPVSRYVLRDAARRIPDLRTLIDHVAEQHVAPADRPTFLRQVHGALPSLRAEPARAAATGPQAVAPPAPTGTPLRPELVAHAQRLLAAHIGPIATVVVRRAAASATSREQFFSLLADQADDAVQREALLAQLWRLA